MQVMWCWAKMVLLLYACMYYGVHWLVENPVQSLVIGLVTLGFIHSCLENFENPPYAIDNIFGPLRYIATHDSGNLLLCDQLGRSRPTWVCLGLTHGSLFGFYRPTLACKIFTGQYRFEPSTVSMVF